MHAEVTMNNRRKQKKQHIILKDMFVHDNI